MNDNVPSKLKIACLNGPGNDRLIKKLSCLPDGVTYNSVITFKKSHPIPTENLPRRKKPSAGLLDNIPFEI
jgi:hypothetical protein